MRLPARKAEHKLHPKRRIRNAGGAYRQERQRHHTHRLRKHPRRAAQHKRQAGDALFPIYCAHRNGAGQRRVFQRIHNQRQPRQRREPNGGGRAGIPRPGGEPEYRQ